MEKSDTIAALAAALIKFQSEMGTVGFDADNPFFKTKYATLTALVEKSKLGLAKNDLVVSQLVTGEGAVTTILMHKTGEYIMGTLMLNPVKNDPQGRGSAITYARRYAYAAILGLVSDEDDDGNSASKSQPAPTARSTPKPKEMTPEEALASAHAQIAKAKTSADLVILAKRIEKSDKFNDEQKAELKNTISSKVDLLDTGTPTVNI